MLLAVSVARCLECVYALSENRRSKWVINVHKHAAALKLVELGIGIIQNLIF